MKKVNISSGITEFEDRTFYGCSALENLSIPEGVEYIDWFAFEGCNDLFEYKVSIYSKRY
ncbi:leucine-rich repeat domain-containing protein [Prevotella copri]|uniref:leucine-rich repeat protein n=1 Tax=Segatella copri TaxID=165179 RepID=UPI001C37F0A8|nr:leucine-rich repeat domain-containing protein [Segatella copri]